LLAILCGVGLGIGAFTFSYAEGLSYLSSDPNACANCHIMRPQLEGWQKASHHTVAVCVDCHLPHDGIEKWIAKAVHGYRHSKAFTFQDFVEPIEITPADQETLQANCVRCHGDLLHDQLAGATTAKDAIRCVHCHDSVGHGPRAALGGAEFSVLDSHETR
jgi:cytochrome c nitrite reductase small subunit